ncbi:uncharacterized protein LOC123515769 [Portunus trituberculatus]|uniref:uncharacterized protein LOC123515769 n=1 Tax=Portunus trituberculatus TaxID=210409 RepID=UPI001E1CC2FF|nr:uncharacterized protein LOC123515769 [Portunus trituberculatus]XP_045130568.1 uncharacterized protein LOC123515769 [Portunus trituberculatus]
MFVLPKVVVVGVVCVLVVLQAQLSQSKGALKCSKNMAPGEEMTVEIPCKGQTHGCKHFCEAECDAYIFTCENGHLEANMEDVELDCSLEKLVVKEGGEPKESVCDPIDDIVSEGEKLIIRYKKLRQASMFKNRGCTGTERCNCFYTVKCG